MRRTQERDDSITSEPSWLGDAEQQLTLNPVRASEAFTFPAAFPHCRLSCCRLSSVRKTKCAEINSTGQNRGQQCRAGIYSGDPEKKYCHIHYRRRAELAQPNEPEELPVLRDADKEGIHKYLAGKVAIEQNLHKVFEIEEGENFDIAFDASDRRKLVITITRP